MYLVCYNLHEALRQSQHRLEVVSQLKVELARHKNQKATPQWAIDLLASQRTKRYLKVTERGDVRLDTNAIKGAAPMMASGSLRPMMTRSPRRKMPPPITKA